ncbi:hypothetical protein J4573_33995 [Actinomadura barringtoniae]|uniref:Uncharacterized protein n=1 Tax=Actinomadura barringtoniae TaxID=1427535 RepID=A0A939PH47_9ACTN|nr:hypothetical protein [Actinomadura barringtoniae]
MTPERAGDRRPRRRFDPGALIAGVFFVGVALLFLVNGMSDDTVAGPEVLIPALLIGLGVVGMIRVLTRSRRRDRH